MYSQQNTITHLSTTQLLRRDALTFNYPSLSSIQRWQAYVASYQMLDVTEGVDLSFLQYPLLKRNLPSSLATSTSSSAGGVGIGNSASNGSGKDRELAVTSVAVGAKEKEKEKEKVMPTTGAEEEAILSEMWKPQMNDDGLAIRVGQGRYKMEYVEGTADWFVHGPTVRLRGVVNKDESEGVTVRSTTAEENADVAVADATATSVSPDINTNANADEEVQYPSRIPNPESQSAVPTAANATTTTTNTNQTPPSLSLPMPTPAQQPPIPTTNPSRRTFLSRFVTRDRTIISRDPTGNPPGTIPALEPERLVRVSEEWERVLMQQS